MYYITSTRGHLILQTHACFPMDSRFLPVFFLLLARIPSVVVATDNDGPGNGDHGQDPEESSSLRPENECRIPPYSDPGRIQESAIVADKERLLFQGRCFLACASHLEEPKVKRISDISVYWPIMKVKKSCVVERMVHECVRGCTLPSHFGDECPRACFDDCISECGGSTNNECHNPDHHEPWIRSTCIIKCASNIKNEANSCRVGCNKAATLRLEEAGAPPKDPTGPPSLNRLESSTVGQFSISFSNAAPAQPRGDDRAVNATPAAFLLRLEETISRNPNPLQQSPMVLDLADYACQQLSVSFAVINTAGLSNFSIPQIININGDDRRIPAPPTNIQQSTEIDSRHGFFGHVIINISWEAPRDGTYLDNFTITVSPARGVDLRCGNESWSATVLPGQTSVSVMAESKDSLPVMDCTYNTMIYATGLDGNSDSLTDSLLTPKFDPDSISFTYERRWDSSENLFWFHLTWTLPPYLFDWNNIMINYLHGFYVVARMIDGGGSVIDRFSSPQIQVPLQQNNPVTFALTYHDTLEKSYHYPQHDTSWQYFIESFQDWNMENLLFTPDLNKQTCRASVLSPAPSVVNNVTVVSYEIQNHEIVLDLTWYPPSTPNGVLASYKICAGEDPLQPDEEVMPNSRRHHCHEDLNVTAPNAIKVTLINLAQYCLFVQIRANNQYVSGNWSQPFIIRLHPSVTCPHGTYKNSTLTPFECLPCPANTNRSMINVTVCPCLPGYFRTSSEGPEIGCTRPPSVCRNMKLTSIGAHSVNVEWERPDFTGRDDFYYVLQYTDGESVGSNQVINQSQVVSQLITGLKPVTDYTIIVTVVNEVSDQDMEIEFRRRCVLAVTTPEGVSSAPVDSLSFGDVVVWNEPLNPNGQIIEYEIQFFIPNTQLRITRSRNNQGTFYAVQDEDRLGGNIHFRVRARTSAGAGQWSIELPLSSAAEETPTPPTTCGACTCPVCPSTAPPCTCPTETPTSPPQPQGVHFVLRDQPLANNSVIALTDVGELSGALLCRTNLTSCCGTVPNRFGQFYYPSGVTVPINSQRQGFYRNRGNQEIRLHRRAGVDTPTGKFRCEIPDSNMNPQNLFITLV